jgi:hypothetical protein
MGLHEFVVDSMEVTAENDMEFHTTLRRLPRGLSAPDRDVRRATGFPPVPEPGTAEEPLAPGTHLVVLSERELRVLGWKRALGGKVRRALTRRRPS